MSIFIREARVEDALGIIQVLNPIIEARADYDYNDLVLSPSFFLESGVKDVIVLDPKTKTVLHHRATWESPKELGSPVRLELLCGCECIV